MRAAMYDSYVQYVIFTGVTEKYPRWFKRELDKCAYTDESRFTFWVSKEERRPDYYEKKLVEDYSVFLRKPNGDIHLTDYDTFQELYITFTYDGFKNSGIAAFEDDCIEYVECIPGKNELEGYPDWFYEYFTESIILPDAFEGYILLSDTNSFEIREHCAVLRNRFGECRVIPYYKFTEHYSDRPSVD